MVLASVHKSHVVCCTYTMPRKAFQQSGSRLVGFRKVVLWLLGDTEDLSLKFPGSPVLVPKPRKKKNKAVEDVVSCHFHYAAQGAYVKVYAVYIYIYIYSHIF